jgi:hypothetical protein
MLSHPFRLLLATRGGFIRHGTPSRMHHWRTVNGIVDKCVSTNLDHSNIVRACHLLFEISGLMTWFKRLSCLRLANLQMLHLPELPTPVRAAMQILNTC